MGKRFIADPPKPMGCFQSRHADPLTASIEALYAEQRQGATSGFTGKRNQIQQQYDEFWKHKSARADVDAYLQGNEDHRYNKNELPRWVEKNNCFTNPKNTILAMNDDCFIFGNRASFDVVQYPNSPKTAGMSFIHLLAVSRDRIYNGVSLNRQNVYVLKNMINLFEKSWMNGDFREAVVEHQRLSIKQDSPKTTEDEERYEIARRHFKQLERSVDTLKVKDFQYGLHLYPDHSVSHLHLHIVAMRDDMRKYSTTEHDLKTKDAHEVLEVIGGPKHCL